LDALLFEQDEDLIDLLRVGVVVRQVVVDLVVGQEAFFLARFEQSLQAVVDLVHQSLPRPQDRTPATEEASGPNSPDDRVCSCRSSSRAVAWSSAAFN